jgi:RNA polymerase sigma factor (sigma-70 family)
VIPRATRDDDLGALYRSLAPQLERIVRHEVHAPEAVIEDACQFAWSRLTHNRARVRRDTVLAWLASTAVHEALKLVRRNGREPSLDALVERGGDFGQTGRGVEAIVEARDRLGKVALLAPRQQRLLWLYALGLSYEEIARYDGCTARTVERQIERGRARLRARESSVVELGSR